MNESWLITGMSPAMANYVRLEKRTMQLWSPRGLAQLQQIRPRWTHADQPSGFLASFPAATRLVSQTTSSHRDQYRLDRRVLRNHVLPGAAIPNGIRSQIQMISQTANETTLSSFRRAAQDAAARLSY